MGDPGGSAEAMLLPDCEFILVAAKQALFDNDFIYTLSNKPTMYASRIAAPTLPKGVSNEREPVTYTPEPKSMQFILLWLMCIIV